MRRRKFNKIIGISAYVVSVSGFRLIEENGVYTTSCASSRDMMGPYYRKGAPIRNDFSYAGNKDEVPLRVKGKIVGVDCNKPLPNIEIDIWHCDHNKDYDMNSDEFKCRGKLYSDHKGEYMFKTFIPPPYGGRPKHIHYLIHGTEEYQELVTQVYFKGDEILDNNYWVYPRDERRIIEVFRNDEGMAEINFNLYLSQKS